MHSCPQTVLGRIFKPFKTVYDGTMEKIDKMVAKHKVSNMEFNIIYDAFNAPPSSPFYGETIENKATMTILPVSMGDMRLINNVLNSTLAGVVKAFFLITEEVIPSYITLRSSPFKIVTHGRHDDNEYFKTPISIEVQINPIKRNQNHVFNLSNYLCLGRVVQANRTWTCVSRNIRNEAQDESQEANGLSQLKYDIPGPGTYAVIFRPRMVVCSNPDSRFNENNYLRHNLPKQETFHFAVGHSSANYIWIVLCLLEDLFASQDKDRERRGLLQRQRETVADGELDI